MIYRTMIEDFLTIEQMRELNALDIDTSDAMMCRVVIRMDSIPTEVVVSKDVAIYWHEGSGTEYYPTYSLSDLLRKLPKYVKSAHPLCSEVRCGVSCFGYMRGSLAGWLAFAEANSEIESAYKLLKWCKENGFV